jgi:signal transduction histidine kinase
MFFVQNCTTVVNPFIGTGATQAQFKALYDENEVSGIQSGLGLHLIRDLAKAINCEIKVESKVNEGTIFTLLLNG